MRTRFLKLKNVSSYLPRMLYDDLSVGLIDEKLQSIESKAKFVTALERSNRAGELWVSPDTDDRSIFLDLQIQRRNGEPTLTIITETVEGGGQPFYLSFTFNHHQLQHQIYVPVQYLLKNWSPSESYSLYCHILDEKPYYGITRRHWLDDRWEEHVSDAKNGKKRLLWQAIENSKSHLACHVLMGTGFSKDEAMHLEEFWVDQCGLHPGGLNLIPGGYAGHRFLAEHNLLGKRFSERDIECALRASESRSQTAKDLWRSAEYAEKVICSGERRLSKDQVKRIRALFNEGLKASAIAPAVQARNTRQVQNVLDGRTYSRVN